MWVLPDTPSAARYVFADAFVNPTTDVPLASHTPAIGGPWVDLVAGLEVVSNGILGIVTSGSTSPVLSSVDVGVSVGTASMDFQFSSLADADYVTLFFPIDTFTKGFFFGIHADGTCPWSYVADDGYTVTGTSSWVPDLLRHTLNINFDGVQFVVSLDGVDILFVPTAGHACTQTGLTISMLIASTLEIGVWDIVVTTP